MSTGYLSPFESILWRCGHDSTKRSTVGLLLLVDRVPERDHLFARARFAMEHAVRLRSRPSPAPLTQVRPKWVEDNTRDPSRHVRFVEVPSPGRVRQLLDLLSYLEGVPFDPQRSPWDLTCLSGLQHGNAAIYLRAHHVLTDGIGGMRLLQAFFDDRRHGSKLTAEASATSPSDKGAAPSDPPANEPASPSWTDVLRHGLTKAMLPISAGITAARGGCSVDALLTGLREGLDLASSAARQVLVTGGPLAPLPSSYSALSHFDLLAVRNAREIAGTYGVSRNDLLVTAAAGAIGLYMKRIGERCPSVRIAIPTRQARDRSAGGNSVAPTRVEVSTEMQHPHRQLGIVSERLAQARNEPVLRFSDAVASAISLLPDRVLLPAFEAQVRSVDLSVTAIPGIRNGRTICGAQIEAAFPLGPRLGVPLNITAFGTGNRLEIGMALDPTAIGSPGIFRECMEEALEALHLETSSALARAQ